MSFASIAFGEAHGFFENKRCFLQLVSIASQCGLWAKGIIRALIMQPAT